MNRLRLALVGIVALVVASSCSVVDPPAVTVGDWSISRADFMAQLDAAQADPQLSQIFGSSSTTSGTAMIETAGTAQLADAYVQVGLWQEIGSRVGVDVSDEEVSAQLEQVSLSEEVMPLAEALIKAQLYQQAVPSKLLEDFDVEAAIRAQYEEDRAAGLLPQEQCLDAIIVAPPPATDPTTGQQVAPDAAAVEAARVRAEQRLAELDGGADFTEVAIAEAAVSNTGQTGSDAGCFPTGGLDPVIEQPVLELEVGERTGVIDLDGGYAIVRLRSRGEQSFDSYRNAGSASPSSSAQSIEQTVMAAEYRRLIQPIIAEASAALGVSVDPLFGRWDAETGQVLTPEGAQPAPVTLLASTDAEPIAP